MLNSRKKNLGKHEEEDQVRKGVRRMPGHLELKKDAPNGETRRGAVRTQRSVDIRMGEPGIHHRMSPMPEYIRHEGETRGTETSKYPEEKKTKVIP